MLERPADRPALGALKARPSPVTKPTPARRLPPPGRESPITTSPSATSPLDQASAGLPAVSTESTARSPSRSAPATVAVATRPSSKVTAISPRRL